MTLYLFMRLRMLLDRPAGPVEPVLLADRGHHGEHDQPHHDPPDHGPDRPPEWIGRVRVDRLVDEPAQCGVDRSGNTACMIELNSLRFSREK